MSTIKKKCKVIMLPANNNGVILKGVYPEKNPPLTLATTNDKEWLKFGKPYHLYIVSNDEIKESDWWINLDDNLLNNDSSIFHLANKAPSCKKIIATTDMSIREHDDTVPYPKTRPALPQIPKSFIKQYCNKPVNEVLVEYQERQVFESEEDYNYNSHHELVISKDNTINILPTKDSWSRQELFNIVKKDFTCKNQIAFLNSFIEELK